MVADGRPRIAVPPATTSRRDGALVAVPFQDRIEPLCERSLYQLEVAGVRVVRKAGCSAIDLASNELASDAIHDGAESILFIDSDIAFDPGDALRILARPEPVVAGVYVKKNQRELACLFAEGITNVVFGTGAPGLYLLKYASGGFLRVQTAVLRRMIADLRLPLCNTAWGRGHWPFFMPIIAARPGRGLALSRGRLGLFPSSPPDRHQPDGRHFDPAIPCRPIQLRLGGRRLGSASIPIVQLLHLGVGELFTWLSQMICWYSGDDFSRRRRRTDRARLSTDRPGRAHQPECLLHSGIARLPRRPQ